MLSTSYWTTKHKYSRYHIFQWKEILHFTCVKTWDYVALTSSPLHLYHHDTNRQKFSASLHDQDNVLPIVHLSLTCDIPRFTFLVVKNEDSISLLHLVHILQFLPLHLLREDEAADGAAGGGDGGALLCGDGEEGGGGEEGVGRVEGSGGEEGGG